MLCCPLAVKSLAVSERIYDKVKPFLNRLEEWRSMARQGSLSALIWQLYRDTYFYDFAGGLLEVNNVKLI
jgi:ATP-dependent helicase/nuclease subunit A